MMPVPLRASFAAGEPVTGFYLGAAGGVNIKTNPNITTVRSFPVLWRKGEMRDLRKIPSTSYVMGGGAP